MASCLCIAGLAGPAGASTDEVTDSAAPFSAPGDKLASAQVPFIGNQGQIPDAQVRFYARTFAGILFVTADNQLVYSLPQRGDGRNAQRSAPAIWSFSESFSGGQPSQTQGESPSAVRVSHYKGDNPDLWQSRLATYDSVSLGEPYPGIRVTLKAAANNVEKLFHVAPGVDAGLIDIAIGGVERVAVNPQQQLVLGTSLGDIVFTAPVAYQTIDGQRQPVDVAYALGNGHQYGFRVGPYDESRALVIDPLLASTYIGGRNPNPPGNYDDDIIHGMVTVGGDVYVAGATQSPDFPVKMGYDETLDSAYPDGFVTRMSGDLSTVIASTYIGTESFDRVEDIGLDDDGTIIAVGQAGYGFPVTDGAYNWSGETPVGGGFIARFSADLATLVASSVATPVDYPRAVALGNGGIYFGGTTNYPDFPITPDAYRSDCCPPGGFGIREYDGFLGKLSADLSTLEAMTYLGGDTVSGISVAPDNGVFVTDGTDHAITGYIARFDDGLTTRSAYLSYYPGSESGSSRTYFNDVAAGEGYVVTAGQTYMNDLPATPGAFDTTCGTDGLCDGVGPLLVPKSDGFVAIYSDDLQDTLALTYLGGSDHESIRSVALDADGDVYVTGETTSVDLPTAGSGVDTGCGIDGQCDPTGAFGTPTPDGFVARLSDDLSQLRYGTYLGGSGEDRPEVIEVDATGLVYAAGYTDSTDFPTMPGAFDTSYNGGTSDAFISRFDTSTGGVNQPPVADAGANQVVGPFQIVRMDGSGSNDPDGQIVQYQWRQLFGKPVVIEDADTAMASFRAPFVLPGITRVLVFELEVIDDQDATGIDRVRIDVTR